MDNKMPKLMKKIWGLQYRAIKREKQTMWRDKTPEHLSNARHESNKN